jgi:PHP family Zn ribbon phosphoesterase
MHEDKKMNEGPDKRPYLGVQFECCSVYTRVYRKPEILFYEARCPKCGRTARIDVDRKAGVDAKFIRVSFE